MGVHSGDTSADAAERQESIFGKMSGEKKLLLSMAWSDVVRDIALAGMRSRNLSSSPDWPRLLFVKEIHGIDLRTPKKDYRHE